MKTPKSLRDIYVEGILVKFPVQEERRKEIRSGQGFDESG